MLTRFGQLRLDQLTREDLDNIEQVVGDDPDNELMEVHRCLSTGEWVPWRCETTKGNVIVLLGVKQRKEERTLFVWYACGKGFSGCGKVVMETLECYAKLNNCCAVELLTKPGFARYLKRFGFETDRIFVRKEVS